MRMSYLRDDLICLLLVAFTSTGCAMISPRSAVRFEGNAVTIRYDDDLEGF
jgi:hypothetical protein